MEKTLQELNSYQGIVRATSISRRIIFFDIVRSNAAPSKITVAPSKITVTTKHRRKLRIPLFARFTEITGPTLINTSTVRGFTLRRPKRSVSMERHIRILSAPLFWQSFVGSSVFSAIVRSFVCFFSNFCGRGGGGGCKNCRPSAVRVRPRPFVRPFVRKKLQVILKAVY